MTWQFWVTFLITRCILKRWSGLKMSKSIGSVCLAPGCKLLRAAAWKIQTSFDSSKKSTFILFHEKNIYIELFSKMEFKTFSEFHFSRNRAMSAFAQTRLGINPNLGKFCEWWAASKSKINKQIVLYQIKVCHLGFSKKVSFYFRRLFQTFSRFIHQLDF